MKQFWIFLLVPLFLFFKVRKEDPQSFIRVNLLGYKPAGIKVAVWCSKENSNISNFQIIDVISGAKVFEGNAGKAFCAYGPFTQTYRLNFSSYLEPGRYVLHAGGVSSPEFTIGERVYDGAADFCLRYMRQQRSGFNPFLKDSCHTYDGYTLYGPMADSTRIDVVGGWHDASDYLQYSTTSANASWHLLTAYRDFPSAFGDQYNASGLDGKNGVADVLDEARRGINWLLKMHPKDEWLFNQLGDDRDHRGMRIPKLDSFYGRGYERPVYFCSGTPQQQGKFQNKTTGVASIAGKFSSAFASASMLYQKSDPPFAALLKKKSVSAYNLGRKKPGMCQTASVLSPYIYAEENWTDDMELAAASMYALTKDKRYLQEAIDYSQKEKLTPWLGADTAGHYQWYPFVNAGHYELAKGLNADARQKQLKAYYKEGITKVWEKARSNAFYRGVPFIWCSNNLTTSFAIQCYWYRQLTNDASFSELEQSNFDWLFGCNPWGTSMVYGLPSYGDTPKDPHSAFTHLKNYAIDGGLVDGPVYGSIYSKLIGIKLYEPDEYASLQSPLVVYHDDYGDYSTNEPTMDGTASLIYLLAAKQHEQPKPVKKKD